MTSKGLALQRGAAGVVGRVEDERAHPLDFNARSIVTHSLGLYLQPYTYSVLRSGLNRLPWRNVIRSTPAERHFYGVFESTSFNGPDGHGGGSGDTGWSGHAISDGCEYGFAVAAYRFILSDSLKAAHQDGVEKTLCFELPTEDPQYFDVQPGTRTPADGPPLA